MTTYTAICRRPNGELVKVQAPPFAQVRFNGAAMNVPKGLLHVRAAASFTRVAAVGTGQNPTKDPDRCYIVNDLGVARNLCQSHGNQAAEIEHDPIVGVFFVFVVETATTYRRFTLETTTLDTLADPGPLPYPPEAPPHTSQGFRDIEPGGEPIWYDDKLTPAIRGGVSFSRYLQRQDWLSGIVSRKNRVGLWDGSQAWISLVSTQLQPRLEIAAWGEPQVAVSDDSGGQFLTLADFQSYDLPPKVDFVPIDRPFLTGAFAYKDAKDVPGEVVLPIRASNAYKQWLLTAKRQILAPADDHAWVPDALLYGIYTGEDAGHGLTFPQAVALGRPVADARKVGLFAFAEAADPIADELKLIRPQDAYLQKAFLNHGETDESFQFRMQAAVTVLRAAGVRFVWVIGCHQRRDEAHPSGLPVRTLCDVPIIVSEFRSGFGALSFRVWPDTLPPEQVDDVPEAVAYARDWYETATGLPAKPRPTVTPIPVPSFLPRARVYQGA